jgi:hypothetical protein
MDDNERAAREVMGWRQGEGAMDYGWLEYSAKDKSFVWVGYLTRLIVPEMLKDEDGHDYLDFRIQFAGWNGVWDPLNKIQDAWLLVRKIHKASGLTQKKFEARLNGIRKERNYLHRYLWLTPAAITHAAVETVGKEKG